MARLAVFAALLSAVSCALAAPAPDLQARSAITALSAADVASFTPYIWFARTAYCNPKTTITWKCGANCDKNPDFEPIASGGDGALEQYWFVGYDPALNTIVVSHQGTDPDKIIPILIDADFPGRPLDPELFPGIDSDIRVHDGFADSHARSATSVLKAVLDGISKYGTKSVTLVGHSLGGALALLDNVYLPLHLPADVSVKMIGFGTPRVGNPNFANYVDEHRDVTRINNEKDPVPIVPPRIVGFRHPSGEVHIDYPSGTWYKCTGQENNSPLCEDGDVPLDDVLASIPTNHLGPYNGVLLGPFKEMTMGCDT